MPSIKKKYFLEHFRHFNFSKLGEVQHLKLLRIMQKHYSTELVKIWLFLKVATYV